MSLLLNKKILLIATGSIASYKSADLTSKLRQLGAIVKVVLSESATQFISPITFEALSGEKVFTSLWEKGETLAHIELVRWADLILVAPATADFIAHLAQGRAGDLPLAMSIAHDFKKPFLIAPAMNPAMFQHPSTQENISKLKNWGYNILPSPEGFMACQETGSGRMLETSDLIEALHESLADKGNNLKHLLLTCGGTSTPIDSVRFITNISSGKTGFELAKCLLRAGHRVTLLRAKSSAQFDSSLRYYTLTGQLKILSFFTVNDLESELIRIASEAEIHNLIQCAAISDFDIHDPIVGKLPSQNEYTLQLRPRKKSIQTFAEKFPNIPIIAFKLTVNIEAEDLKSKLMSLFENSSVLSVIHNTLERVTSGDPTYKVYNSNLNVVSEFSDTQSLGVWLSHELGRIKE